MNVRAKMKCWSVLAGNSPNPDDTCVQVQLMAVYDDGNEENKVWSKYTPSAQVSIYITNPTAADAFEPGKSYYVDFTPAE